MPTSKQHIIQKKKLGLDVVPKLISPPLGNNSTTRIDMHRVAECTPA